MKLWVDDIRPAPNDEWIVAKTITSAIRALSNFEFEEISLDHDISHQVSVGELSRPYPCEECFCSVAYFIGANIDMTSNEVMINKPDRVIIHTSSPVGAKDMESILKRYGIKPEIKMMGLTNRLEMEIDK